MYRLNFVLQKVALAEQPAHMQGSTLTQTDSLHHCYQDAQLPVGQLPLAL